MSNGSYQAVVYGYPVHELVDGVWVEIESTNQNARGDVSPDSARSNILDNYVWEGHGVQDSDGVRLYIGNKSGYECQAYIQFATVPTIPAGATITTATMTVNIVSGTSTANNAKAFQVTGSEWTSGTLQWSNKPAADILLEENISHNNKTKYQFSCLSAVQHWYDGDTTGQNENYGIMLCYQDPEIADYNSFYSADCTDATMRPALTINYTPANSSLDVDVGATLALSLSGATGTVTWTSSNTSVATVNSSGVVTGIQVGSATITASIDNTVQKTFKVYVTIANGIYRIVNTAGLSLATSGSIAENTLAKMRARSDSGFEKLYQLWRIMYLGNGYYSIRPIHKLDMGLHAAGTMGSSVDIVTIGTNDTLNDVPPHCRWGISLTSDGYCYFINHIGTSSLGMAMDGQTASIDMGVITDISSETQGYFKWMLEEVNDLPSGAKLYDTSTGNVVTTPRNISVGETKSLSDLNLLPIGYSFGINSGNFQWESDDSTITVNRNTGAVTGVSVGTATITGTYNHYGTYYDVSFTIYVGASFETTMTKLADLYEVALEYDSTPYDAALLTVQFIRRLKYNDDAWTTVAGAVDSQFVDYVETNYPSLYAYFTIEPAEEYYYLDPNGEGYVDFRHLCAALNGLLYDSKGFKAAVAGEGNVDNLCGWAGDLQTLCIEVLKYTNNSNDYDTVYSATYDLIGDEAYSLSMMDLLADTDAYNIHQLLNSSSSNFISAFTTYYDDYVGTRYTRFTNGWSKQTIYDCVRNYTTNTFFLWKDWPLLEGYNITNTQANAIASAFTDFIWEKIQNE